MYPPVQVLTDCVDINARSRLSARNAALFGAFPAVFPLTGSTPEVTAGLTLLDLLLATDALGESGGATITQVNVAPRTEEWPNGAPFCYFWGGANLVVSTFSALTLSYVRQHLAVEEVHVTDAHQVMESARAWTNLTTQEAGAIAGTQFRSLWFQPLLTKWLFDDRPVPSTRIGVPPVPDTGAIVAYIDNFGNCKINRTGVAVGFAPGNHIKILIYDGGKISATYTVCCYSHLSAVPRDEAGLIVGSSGRGLLELVVRSGSAAQRFQLAQGTRIFLLSLQSAAVSL